MASGLRKVFVMTKPSKRFICWGNFEYVRVLGLSEEKNKIWNHNISKCSSKIEPQYLQVIYFQVI